MTPNVTSFHIVTGAFLATGGNRYIEKNKKEAMQYISSNPSHPFNASPSTSTSLFNCVSRGVSVSITCVKAAKKSRPANSFVPQPSLFSLCPVPPSKPFPSFPSAIGVSFVCLSPFSLASINFRHHGAPLPPCAALAGTHASPGAHYPTEPGLTKSPRLDDAHWLRCRQQGVERRRYR